MGKITGMDQGEKGMYKPPIYTGLREVQLVTVIRTLNYVGTGTDGDPVKTVWQYWTEEGIQITTEPTRFDCFVWLEAWKDFYEEQIGDGKAREFYDWINKQPMTTG